MAATADLQVHKEGGGDQATLASAAASLSACRQLMERIQREHHRAAPADAAATFLLLQVSHPSRTAQQFQSTPGPRSTPFHLQEFNLASRLKDRAKQTAALAQCQRAAGVSADHFLQLATLSRSSGSPALEKECLSVALERLTQGAPLTALDLVAQVRRLGSLQGQRRESSAGCESGEVQVLRRILCLSNSDEEKLGLYCDARTLLKDAPAGRYPPQEAAWLVTTCFNRGCQHAKFCRFATASDFMHAALGLLPFCQELSAKREVVRRAHVIGHRPSVKSCAAQHRTLLAAHDCGD